MTYELAVGSGTGSGFYPAGASVSVVGNYGYNGKGFWMAIDPSGDTAHISPCCTTRSTTVTMPAHYYSITWISEI